MRAIVAATLALLVLVAAGVPHEHVHHGAEDCIACAVGQGSVAQDETPDVAPATVVLAAPVLEPGPAPVSGAPIGAVPGQSPPTLA
jgi:hypothetical protein